MKTEKKRALTAIVLLLLTVIAFSLGGCVKKYSRGDIRSYARKLTGRKNLTVSEGYTEIQEDEEGYLDHLWTVTDEDSGITFHVLDDYYWSLEAVENRLLDDYDSSVFLSLLENGRIPQENGLALKRTDHSGIVQAELICSYTDMAELNERYRDLLSIRAALEEAGYPGLKIPYTVKYKNPIRGAVDYDIDEGDTSGEIGSIDEDALAAMRRGYLVCALDYRFEDALREFDEKEIGDLVNAESTVRIYRRKNDGAGTSEKASAEDYYEGVIGSPQYAGISFGTLYELLRQDGYQPEGTPWHYSVKAPDGSRLEFSYDFNDLSGFNDSEGKLQKGYYYIKNDKKVRMKSYYDNHFSASQIEELTGLRIAEDRPYVTEKSQ